MRHRRKSSRLMAPKRIRDRQRGDVFSQEKRDEMRVEPFGIDLNHLRDAGHLDQLTDLVIDGRLIAAGDHRWPPLGTEQHVSRPRCVVPGPDRQRPCPLKLGQRDVGAATCQRSLSRSIAGKSSCEGPIDRREPLAAPGSRPRPRPPRAPVLGSAMAAGRRPRQAVRVGRRRAYQSRIPAPLEWYCHARRSRAAPRPDRPVRTGRSPATGARSGAPEGRRSTHRQMSAPGVELSPAGSATTRRSRSRSGSAKPGCARPGSRDTRPLRHCNDRDPQRVQVRVTVLHPRHLGVARGGDAELPSRVGRQLDPSPAGVRGRSSGELPDVARRPAQVAADLAVGERVASVNLIRRAMRVRRQVERRGACHPLVYILPTSRTRAPNRSATAISPAAARPQAGSTTTGSSAPFFSPPIPPGRIAPVFAPRPGGPRAIVSGTLSWVRSCEVAGPPWIGRADHVGGDR